MEGVSYKRILCVISSIVGLFLLSWLFFEFINVGIEERLDFYLGAVSVFSGAYMAFWFNRYQDRQKEIEETKKSLSLSLYIFSAQLNVVANLKKEWMSMAI